MGLGRSELEINWRIKKRDSEGEMRKNKGKRMGMVIGIKKEKVEKYKELNEKVWKEIMEIIRE